MGFTETEEAWRQVIAEDEPDAIDGSRHQPAAAAVVDIS